MKRMLSMLLAIVMVFSMLPVMAFAEGTPTITFTTSFEDGMEAGDTFTVTASLSNNPGIGTITLSLDWNSDVVQFDGFSRKAPQYKKLVTDVLSTGNVIAVDSAADGIPGKVTAADNDAYWEDGVLFTANFTVLAGGALGLGLKTGTPDVYQIKNEDGSADVNATINLSAIENLTAAGAGAGPTYDLEWPFTKITTDQGDALQIESLGEHYTNAMMSDQSATLYRVVIPQDATYADITMSVPLSDFERDQDPDTKEFTTVAGYAGIIDGAGAMASFENSVIDAQTTLITMPMTLEVREGWGTEPDAEYSLVKPADFDPESDNLYMAAPEYSQDAGYFAPVCYFTFEYGEAAPTPPAHEHTYKKNVVDAKYLKTAATCQEFAIYYKSCECGAHDATTETALFYDEAAGKADHIYTQENANDGTKKSDATCQSFAVYYKSCICGEVDKSENAATFEYGTTVDCVYENGACKWCGTEQPTYTITVNSNENGTVYAVTDTNSTEGINEAVEGATIYLKNTPAAGYRLVSYTVQKVIEAEGEGTTYEDVTVENNSFTMPAVPVQISATFEAIPAFSITVDPNLVGGTVIAKDGIEEESETITQAQVGTPVYLFAEPAPGYEISGMPTYTYDGQTYPTENGGFYMPTADVTVSATFVPIDYTITLNKTGEGNVTLAKVIEDEDDAPVDQNTVVHVGDKIKLAIEPTNGYLLTGVTATYGEENTEFAIGSEFTMPAGNLTINVTFTQENKIAAVEPKHPNIVVEEGKDGKKTYSMSLAEDVTESIGSIIDSVMENVPVTQKVQWYSSDENVATVDADTGAITAVTPSTEPINIYAIAVDEAFAISNEEPEHLVDIALTVKAVPAGHIATMNIGNTSNDASIVKGESVTVPIYVQQKAENGDKTDVSFKAYEVTLEYSDCLTLTGLTDVTVNKDTATGYVTLYHYGEAELNGVLNLSFKGTAIADGYVKLISVKVGDSDTALVENAANAEIVDNVTQVAVKGYTVDLPDVFNGSNVADPTQDYTFWFKDSYTALHDYTFTVKVNGQDVAYTGTGTKDDPYTIAKEAITGNIEIKITSKTGKYFDVTITGDKANRMNPVEGFTTGENAAQYGKDYQVKLTPEEGKEYNVQFKIGEETKTYQPDNLIYTIPGTDITGDIVIIVNEKASSDTHNVEFIGRGAGDKAENTATEVADGEDYTFVVNQTKGFAYTVTATMGNDNATVTLVSPTEATVDETAETVAYTYKIENVTADLIIKIDKTDREVKVISDYVNVGEGASAFLVKVTETLFENEVLTYAADMMYVKTTASNEKPNEGKQEWQYLVVVTAPETTEGEEGTAQLATLTDEQAAEYIAIATLTTDGEGNMQTIKSFVPSFDVNGSGIVDINDAQLVYDMYKAEHKDNVTDHMSKFLRANVVDQEGQAIKIDTADAAAVVNAIIAQKSQNG